MSTINKTATVVEDIESTEALLRKRELDKKVAQLEKYMKDSPKRAYYYLMVSLKNFRLSFSYLRTSLTALLFYFESLAKLVLCRVHLYLVSR